MEIPQEVKNTIKRLNDAGYEAYIVGGCVRDFLHGADPKDWDIATSARPEEVQKIFPENFYENAFLTVTIITKSKNPVLKEIEITTYRSEAKYSDKRHPDEVKFAKNLEDDLKRRDFTINAMALRLSSGQDYEIIDLFSGQEDLKKRIIRAVGNPEERFAEDALRMMRAVRLATVLGFEIEEKTGAAIKKQAKNLKDISEERIRDEFLKTIISDRAAQGIELFRKTGLLKYFLPEVEEGYGVGQNKHHKYDCYEHNLRSLDYATKKGFNANVRVAALFHDVGKPKSKRGQGLNSTFYGHEVIGAKMAESILSRLKFSKKDADKIVNLIRHHLFYYNVGEVTDSSVRRLVRQVGPENMEELLQLRMADRIGSGVPKAEPYKLRHFKYVVEKVSQDPISAKMLKVSGNDVMKILGIKPGPKVGQILDVLLEKVLDDPKNNNEKFLRNEVKNLGGLSQPDLISLQKEARKEREKVKTKRDEMTKQKYWVT